MSDITLINALQNPKLYDHSIKKFTLLETHLSWVILTGDYAYKIKKPVDFGFVNYTTLERRYHYCKEEFRLNKVYAPNIYQQVVTINGTPEAPMFDSEKSAIEYAIKMAEFPQEALFNVLAHEHKILPEHINQLAADIAHFHQRSAIAPLKSPYGRPEKVHEPVQENFDDIIKMLRNKEDIERIKQIEAWARKVFEDNHALLVHRKQNRLIRECHGDIHLGNIVLIDNQPTIFDCIEFNDEFRWIDVLADIAFLAMDLDNHGYSDFSHQLVNQYMQQTGDYAGLPILRYYQSYRAMVRAKVTLIRLQQQDLSAEEKRHLEERYDKCIELALDYTQPQAPWLAITHGLSCSGKSTVGKFVTEKMGALQIRSDVERKRLHGLAAEEKSDSTLLGNIYTPNATKKTYDYLAELAKNVINAGYSAIIDATFLKHAEREAIHALAQQLNVPFLVLHAYAPDKLLEQRVTQRQQEHNDPSEADMAVLQMQQETIEPLTDAEKGHTISVDSEKYHSATDLDWILAEVKAKTKSTESVPQNL